MVAGEPAPTPALDAPTPPSRPRPPLTGSVSPSSRRPTISSERLTGWGKTPALVTMEMGARDALVRASRTRSTTARLRATHDCRRSVLHSSWRASGDRSTDARTAGDFGVCAPALQLVSYPPCASLTNLPALSHACDQLLPCALPLHRRGRTPDPVERAARALQCAPAGWLVLECRVSPYERWARDEARRRSEAEAAEQAAATAAVQAAAEVAAEATRVASEREHLDATRAMTEDIERLRVEIMANADKKGMLD